MSKPSLTSWEVREEEAEARRLTETMLILDDEELCRRTGISRAVLRAANRGNRRAIVARQRAMARLAAEEAKE